MLPGLRYNLNIPRESAWFQAAVLSPSTLLCVVAAWVSWRQPDSWAAFLILPRWLWPLPGLFLALLGWTRRRRILATGVAVLWLLYALVFIEEISDLTRWPRWPLPEWQKAHPAGAAIRVVSLNCSGDEQAFAEVGRYHPDVVLLQESPGRLKVRALADAVVGPGADTLLGGDVSIIVRGKLTPVPPPRLGNVAFTQAHVQLASGLKLDVICVRLRPYDPRVDLWSPECWRTQRSIRQQQRWQINQLVDRIRSIPDTDALVVGGDFNLPAHDRMLRSLRPRLSDTFKKSGRGWGNTMDNDIPFLRIDQIWCSHHFRPASVVTRHTLHTDHRMLVGDLVKDGKPDPIAR